MEAHDNQRLHHSFSSADKNSVCKGVYPSLRILCAGAPYGNWRYTITHSRLGPPVLTTLPPVPPCPAGPCPAPRRQPPSRAARRTAAPSSSGCGSASRAQPWGPQAPRGGRRVRGRARAAVPPSPLVGCGRPGAVRQGSVRCRYVLLVDAMPCSSLKQGLLGTASGRMDASAKRTASPLTRRHTPHAAQGRAPRRPWRPARTQTMLLGTRSYCFSADKAHVTQCPRAGPYRVLNVQAPAPSTRSKYVFAHLVFGAGWAAAAFGFGADWAWPPEGFLPFPACCFKAATAHEGGVVAQQRGNIC